MTTTIHTLKDLKCEYGFISLGDKIMGIRSVEEPGEIINTNQNITLLPTLDEFNQGFETAQKARIYMLKFFFIKGKRKGIVGDKILYADTKEEVPDTEKVFITFNTDDKMIYANTKEQVHGDDNDDNFVVVQRQEIQKKQGGKKRRSSHKKRRSSHKKRRSRRH